jgi:alpha/beta superfamily hydrolase
MAAPSQSERQLVDGAAGSIEVAIHRQDGAARALAVIAHPHPLYGGTMDNKVVTTLARALFDAGAEVYRFNFRGVGKSEGEHDNGRGETQDMLRVIAFARGQSTAELPLWVAGFSFGGAVALAASEQQHFERMILVAPAFARMAHWQNVASGGNPPPETLLIHGELDETVPFQDSLDWARPRDLVVSLVPGADHFFHQRLHIVKRLAFQHVANRGVSVD